MAYYLAPSLVKLRDQINDRWPSRSKASDGWIGDAAHNARKSDHNPDYASGGVVRAIDVTLNGVNMAEIIAAVQSDSRTSYFIHKGVIRGEPGFSARKYTGANAHNIHIHISIKHTKAAESGHAWKLGGGGGSVAPVKTPAKPKPKGTAENKSIQTALKAMGLSVGVIDGVNGSMQKAAVKAFQKHHGLVQDGNWGPVTQKAFTLNKAVQSALKAEGYSKQGVDGYYGAQTAANVRDFQKRTKLKVDGLAGPATLKRLGIK